jgi:hypothetical protein
MVGGALRRVQSLYQRARPRPAVDEESSGMRRSSRRREPSHDKEEQVPQEDEEEVPQEEDEVP